MKKIIFSILFILGLALMLINIYGLFQELRSPLLANEVVFSPGEFRFANESLISANDAIAQLSKRGEESDFEFALRANKIIEQGLFHIHWENISDTQKYNQLVPIWENYFLYFMGRWSGIPEFEKYHFANYKRSLERGIGICGDASMALSQVLSDQGIENKIVSFPDHVVVSASFSSGEHYVLDPDFGVVIPHDINELKNTNGTLGNYYLDAGFKQSDALFFNLMANQVFEEWDGVKHFITKKYYFEYISYVLKWLFPLLLLIISTAFFIKQKNKIKAAT
jgi:hypothetical protein